MQNNTFSTLFVGQNFIKLLRVDSTNTYLKNLLAKSEPLPDGTVIMADEQFAGRGQMDAEWISKAGENLTFSVYLKTNFLPVELQFYLNRVVSLSVYDVLYPLLGEGLKIKWPNDIYYKDKKIGGILIENAIQGSALKSSIIGIGLNVNQHGFNAELADKAGSIFQFLQKNVDVTTLMTDICQALEKYYFQLKARKFQMIASGYEQHLYKKHEIAKFIKDGELFVGEIIGVTDAGYLEIQTEGDIKRFAFKELSFVQH